MSATDWMAVVTTLKLATTTTVVLLALGTPLAWWLARTRSRIKFLVESIVTLPLILPPTVLGFYLLLLLGANGPLAKTFDTPLAFSFTGLLIGSVIYSLPFVVQPLQNSFTSIHSNTLEAAATLGASPWDRFWSVVFPQSRQGFLTATVLGFAHTVGEFGVVLMIGGNIPGETQVVSIAIYDHVEAMEYRKSHLLSGGLLIFSFLLLSFVYGVGKKFKMGPA